VYGINQQRIENILKSLDGTLTKPHALADDVKRLSDYYIKNPDGKTPWQEPWCQRAYVSYYDPLNTARAFAAWSRVKSSTLVNHFDQIIDFGSGLGAMVNGYQETGLTVDNVFHLEISPQAIQLHRRLVNPEDKVNRTWSTHPASPISKEKNICATFSYSLTELPQLPEWAYQCQSLFIMEPATYDDSRKLIQLRQKLIEGSYSILAPCTHQKKCPMLQNNRDWCHDRLQWTSPEWIAAIESKLPFKNHTLPFSYLFAKKITFPFTQESNMSEHQNTGRTVGDLLHLKGHSKQLFCKDGSLSYLSWQHKYFGKNPSGHARGDLVSVHSDWPLKGTEIRIIPDSSEK
jgi:hypothetical protein